MLTITNLNLIRSSTRSFYKYKYKRNPHGNEFLLCSRIQVKGTTSIKLNQYRQSNIRYINDWLCASGKNKSIPPELQGKGWEEAQLRFALPIRGRRRGITITKGCPEASCLLSPICAYAASNSPISRRTRNKECISAAMPYSIGGSDGTTSKLMGLRLAGFSTLNDIMSHF